MHPIFRPAPVYALFLFASCGTTKSYLPERTVAPMLKERNEVKLTLSTKVQGDGGSSHFGFSPAADLAWSPFQHVGVFGGYRHTDRFVQEQYYSFWSGTEIHDYRYLADRYLFGAGYYMQPDRFSHFEVYAGYASGRYGQLNITSGRTDYSYKYRQYFIQPAYGVFLKDFFDACAGIKFMCMQPVSIESYEPAGARELTKPATNFTSVNYYFIDPFANLNVGGPFIKFNFQVGANLALGSPRMMGADLPIYVSCGTTLSISPHLLSKKK